MKDSLLIRAKKVIFNQGPYFLAYALLADLFDELIIPGILAYYGHPILGLTVFAADLDWITYPLFFAISPIIKNLFSEAKLFFT